MCPSGCGGCWCTGWTRRAGPTICSSWAQVGALPGSGDAATTGQPGWHFGPASPGGLPTLTAPPAAAFTDDGKILKVALAGGASRGPEVISLEEISVTKVQAARVAPRGLKCHGWTPQSPVAVAPPCGLSGRFSPPCWGLSLALGCRKRYRRRGEPMELEPSHLPAPHPVPEGRRGCTLVPTLKWEG